MTGVVVVGAGLIGASIARRLAERGVRVEVVEATRPAGGTSLATFAWVNAVGKQPRAYFDLNVEGAAEHRRLADELGGGTWYHSGGNLEWSSEIVELRAKVDRHRELGYPVEWLEPAHARELEPDAVIEDAAGVAFYPHDAWIDPVVLVVRLLDHPRITARRGVPVTRLDTDHGRVHGVALADGRRIGGDAVVVATGPSAAELLEPIGFDLPMRHAPGLLALTEPAPVAVTRILHAPGVAVRPDGAGRLLLAADDLDKRIEPAGGDLSIADAADELLVRARRALPGLAGVPVEVTRLGRRALTADGMPAIGPVPGADGAYLATMHSGVTLAPLVGRLVAAELVDGTADDVLQDYRPARFASASRAQQPPAHG